MIQIGQPEVEMEVAQVPTRLVLEPTRILVAGKLFRTAGFRDEEWREAAELGDPLAALKETENGNRGADVFSFTQPIHDKEIRYRFPYEMRNAAAVPITTYADWWENRVPQETRKNVRRSGRRGVTTAKVEFGDELVRGIKMIYDETPIRQGRRFWHYRKGVEVVRRENATYRDRCDFIGAYFEGTLIGFIKIVYVDRIARIMQIVAMQAHEDKRPTNALLAKAIEVCGQRGMSHFVYGQYVYGNKTRSPMTEFKRRNGFERLDFPRYHVPLTLAGKIYVALGLYRGLSGLLPEPVIEAGLAARTRLRSLSRGHRNTGGTQLRVAE